jgi:hypothetical protein
MLCAETSLAVTSVSVHLDSMETHLLSVKVRVLSLAASSTTVSYAVSFGSLNYAALLKSQCLRILSQDISHLKFTWQNIRKFKISIRLLKDSMTCT